MSIAAAAGPVPAPVLQLSTDYLNRFVEPLMLLEMVQLDPGILQELKAWRPVGYCEHFEASQLRCKLSALAAYHALEPASRAAFEDLCGAMSRLIATATALLCELSPEDDASSIATVAGESLRRLIARANQFILANGDVELAELKFRELQDEIDVLFD